MNNPKAFPNGMSRDAQSETGLQSGMSLWDYYAAAALSGMGIGHPEQIADAAALRADFLLAEREKRGIK